MLSKKECSDFLMGEASELLHSHLGIEDPELVILNVNLKSREGCTESVRFDKRTRGPSLPANKKTTFVAFLFAVSPEQNPNFFPTKS